MSVDWILTITTRTTHVQFRCVSFSIYLQNSHYSQTPLFYRKECNIQLLSKKEMLQETLY